MEKNVKYSSKVPTLLVGPPGAGKTADVLASFDYVEVCLASTLVEEDIGGLPYREGNYDYRTVPAIFRRLQEADDAGKTTALFLDELDKARRSVADTLLTLIASRKVGGGELPERSAIIAAANPPEFGGGDGISDAMISRFCVVDYVPSPSRWAEWAQSKFSSARTRRVIERVRCGEIPIIDITGEGLARRITSPRTIAMALTMIDEGRAEHIGGVLTAATASQIQLIAENTPDDVLNMSTDIRRSASTRKAVSPLRLP